MRIPLLIALVLVPAMAHADKEYTGGKGATWDCAKDPVIKITHGGGTYTFTGACKTIDVSGGDNTLHVGAVESITVIGGGNVIDIGEVAAISVNGAGNKVMWKKAKGDKPTINVIGNNNTVARS
ncbi:MAG TPA: DUF3060 domain-containing protein [Kofleriaceae bacterium]|nr:DUF3060 domain-containing protein [Kofleriaceae bacterium]